MVGEVISESLEDEGSLSGCYDLSFYGWHTESKEGVYAQRWWARAEHPKRDQRATRKKKQNLIGGNYFWKTHQFSQ